MENTGPHPMMPVSSHDELAEQRFVTALKSYIFKRLDPQVRDLTEQAGRVLAEAGESSGLPAVRRRLELDPGYQNWVSMMRAGQELMWQSCGDCVDRQRDRLEQLAVQSPDLGSLRLDEGFELPSYLAAADTHIMPGGYFASFGDRDVRQGALYDKAASLYSLGRQGGELNDMRGHTVVAHLFDRFSGFTPTRILEMGCTVGNSAVAVADYFPKAEMHAIDVGAGLLRYARARAAYLGKAIQFSQQSAESTDFEDGFFDFIYSSAMLHETSNKAVKRIFAECYRLLKPGGVMIHLEVPVRAEGQDLFGQVRGDYEARYNNEPFWSGIASMDLARLAADCGFKEVAAGFQDAVTASAHDAGGGFGSDNRGPYRSWYMVSGRRNNG